MFPDVDLKVERLGESNHTLFALEISFISKMVHYNMFFHNRVVMATKVTLTTVVTVSLSIEFYVDANLCLSRCQRCFFPFNFNIHHLRTVLRMALLPFRTRTEVVKFGVFRVRV